ncbi:hypothetical protein MMC25_000527 [Agyrium rufum]|nr:hypothetical protein [Agyrium rufum]
MVIQEKHLHPHHQILPPRFQTTDKGREAAEAAYAKNPENAPSEDMASRLALTDLLPLPNSAVQIPRLGFGVYLSSTKQCIASCTHALNVGYRHIDTAQYYGNETEVGTAVRDWMKPGSGPGAEKGLSRKDIFITTKILAAGKDFEASYKKCKESVDKIDPGEGGYVDLFLIHSPSSGSIKRKEMWTALERLHEEGKAKSIGVSNYGVGHIDEMKGYAKIWPPHVNQIELHPWCQQRTITQYCDAHKIIIEAYSPIVRGQKSHDPTLVKISKKHGHTPAQILIRYCLQKGWVPLPKSDTPSRIEENMTVYGFELDEEDMKTLNDLDQGDQGAIVQAVRNELR